MNPIHLPAAAVMAFALVSCATQSADTYDTANPYGFPDAGMAGGPMPDYENPVYDTPAAYEYTQPASPAPTTTASTPSAPTGGTQTVHTVVRGDTLWGLSNQYNVPISSIKRANNMTNDTVVLGRKLVIPSH